MIRKIGVFLIVALGLVFTAKGQAPPSAFTYKIYGDTCAPVSPNGTDSLDINFYPNSILKHVTYSWNFGTSGCASQTGPVVDAYFKKSGTFTITLTATDSLGSSTTTKNITVKCRPKISFAISDSMGCSPLAVTLTASSSGCTGTDKFHWFLGGLKYSGSTLKETFQSYCYSTPSVDISDTFSNGCVATFHKDTIARITPVPSVSFTPSPISTCSTPDTVTYTNTSTGGIGTCNPPMKYRWTFPSGSPASSTAKSPHVIYSATGKYDSKLVVTNTRSGCSDSLTKSSAVTVLGAPTSSITASATSVCQCGSITITWTGSPTPSNVAWSSTCGLTIPTGTSVSVSIPCTATPGSCTITGTPTYSNGCSASSKSVTFTIAGKPAAHYTVSDTIPTCVVPKTVVYTGTTVSGAVYNWLFTPSLCTKTSGAGTNKFTIIYSCPGKYKMPVLNVTLSGCANQYQDTNSIEIDSMKAMLTTPTQAVLSGLCTPARVSFHSNQSKGFPKPNYFKWTLRDSAGTIDTMAVDTGIYDSLVYKFRSCGKKYLTLLIKNKLGCQDTQRSTLQLGGKQPATIFTYDSFRCYHDTISFSTKSVFSCRPTTMSWYIDWPKYTSTGYGNKFTTGYLDTGYHRIALITSNNGCLDTIVKPERILVKGPRVHYLVKASCNSNIIEIDVGKKEGSILPKDIEWYNHGIGKHLTWDHNDTTIYDTATCFNRFFQVYFKDSIGSKVCVDSLPYAGYIVALHRQLKMADTLLTDTAGCFPYTLKIKNSSNSCGFSPEIGIYYARVYRDCGNGKYVYYTPLNNSGSYYKSGDTISTSALLPGRYKITVVGIISTYGYPFCIDSLKLPHTISIYGVKAGFKNIDTPFTGCGPLPVQLVDTSSASCGLSSITSYKWSVFQPGSTTALYDSFTVKTPPKFSLKSAGCYSIQYKITDNKGCIDSSLAVNYICVVKPGVSFTVSQDSVCGTVKLSFTSSVTTSGSGTPKYVWYFGNGDTSHAQNPTYTYPDSSLSGGPSFKLYTVTLDVSNGGCDSAYTHNVYVTYPHININVNPSTPQKCPPVFATLICTNPKDALIYDWNYDYPNSSTEVVTSAPHDTIYPVYYYPGTYAIHLTVITKGGCVDTLTVKSPIQIDGPKLKSKSVTPKLGCSPLLVQLKAYSPGPIRYQWQQTKDSVRRTSTGDSIFLKYTSRGKFLTYVIVTDTVKHCTVKYPLDSVNIATPVARFHMSDTVVCSGQPVRFTDSSTTSTYITGRTWYFGDGTTSTAPTPSHIYTTSTAQYYTVKLVSTANPGCHDTAIKKIHVWSLPVVKLLASDSNVCPHTRINFIDSSQGTVTTRKWNYGSGSTFAGAKHVSYLYDTSGTYTAKLIIVAGTGCGDSITKTITVYTLPPVKAGADTGICIGDNAYLHASGAASYLWHYIPSSDSTKYNPVVAPTVTTTYTVTGTDVHRCVDTSSVIVYVNKLPVVSLGGDRALCINDSIALVPGITFGKSPYKYAWTPGSVLSSTSSAAVFAKPLKTVKIKLFVTDSNRCRGADTIIIKVNPLPLVSAGRDTGICIGFCAPLKASGAQKYNWKPMDDSSANIVVCPTPAGIYTYTLTGIDSNKCKAVNHVIVTVHPKPAISAGTDQTICRNVTATLKASGGVRYVWSPADSILTNDTLASVVVKPAVNGTFTVTGTDVYGCVNSGSVRVFVVQPVEAEAKPEDTTVCYNVPFLEQASGGNFYRWLPQSGLSSPYDSSTFITLKSDATYIVIVSNQCFSDTDTVVIHVQPLPTVVVTPHASFITIGGAVTLVATGSGPGVYSWLPNNGIVSGKDSNVVLVQPNVNTTYTVTFGSGPCRVTDSSIITLKCASFRFPNVFTPGQDQNNYFHPIGVSLSRLISFRIYDRWGNMMYSSTNQEDKGWDGTRNGTRCEQGVYVYYIEAVCTDGEIIRSQGNITLIR